MEKVISSLSAVATLLAISLLVIFVDGEDYIATTETPGIGNDTSFNIVLFPAITGGSPTLAGEFPFMAALGWLDEFGELKYHGGGMIISPKMVLTAAHCVYKDGKIPDVVFIGGESLKAQNNDYRDVFLKFSVVNVSIYPEYDPTQGYDDIAILELDNPTWFPSVCLWKSPNLPIDDVTAIGYGLTEF
ncbi:serine protease snake-like, partial [Eupeodes corollae]|uniref:serine protease snake-like n=1 Tax=Eupeodes corollae TaxID=290404 RepID=UPI0024937982